MAEKTEIVIIGGGPGGYLAALRAAQLGKKAILVEEDRVGGTCMNYGCIPTKYLLHQTKIFKDIKGAKNLDGPVDQVRINWAKVQTGRKAVVDRLVSGLEFLLEKGSVAVVKGRALIRPDLSVSVRTSEGERCLRGERLIVAAGSRSAGLPFLRPDGETVVTSTEALEFPEVPKTLIVIGAGAIGLEMGTIYRRLGTDVTVLEILPNILPGSDTETAARLERILKRQGMKILTQMSIDEALTEDGAVVLRGVALKTQARFEYRAERVLIAAGRRPNTDRLFDGEPALDLGKGGVIRVDAALESSRPGVYAIGDVIGGKLLAHKAYHDAVVAADNASGAKRTADYTALPMAVFTEPEFASVGLTQEEAAARGGNVQTGVFPLQASGRALTMDGADGMVKIVADGKDRVLGAHLLSPAASEMIPLLTAAVAGNMNIRDVASLIYVHPTLSEAVGEAALKAKNEALHILNT